MKDDADIDEVLFAALYAEAVGDPYPIKRANPFPTRNPESYIDPLMYARSVPLDSNSLIRLMLKPED